LSAEGPAKEPPTVRVSFGIRSPRRSEAKGSISRRDSSSI